MKNPWLWRRDGVGWGQVCVRGTGIQTAVIYDRWRAGETPHEVATDYGLSIVSVTAAIAYELGRRHKRTQAWREALED